ncbi:hypothetical protein BGZ83_003703 [Gryganskiella cystojenkinii]|nr:hypothetical protein BGZ83_003703 [Gryganskiella cystojenkinii]
MSTTMADDVVDINTGSSGHGDGRGILLPVAISQSQNDNLQSPSFRSPSPPLDPNPLMPALRRKSTGGYMSPPPRRAHPYKSSRPLIKPRANFALSLNRCSPGVRQSSPQQQQYQPHHRQQSQQPTSGFRSPAALPDLRYLDQKLEHLQHLQQQQQQQQQDGPSSSKPIPIDARNEPVEASMAAAVVPASPFAIAFAVATMTPTTSPVVRVDDVHNNKRPSPYPFETHNTNMTNQFGDHQEDHDSELDQSDDMDEIISEKAPEEHERDLNRARAEIELAKEQYKEAYSKLRDAQERENAILFEQDMQLRIDEDRFHKQQTQQQQQQQQQQQPSSSFSERVGTAARPSEMRLFSEGLGSQRSSFSPALSTTGTSFSQGFMSFVQHRPEIQPPSPSLVRDIQLQQQQREASRPSEEVVRSGNDTGHEVEDSRARVVPQVDDTPLTYLHGRQQQQQQQQQFFPVNSPSVLPTRIKTEEQDVKPSRPQQQQHQQFWPRGRGWYRDYIVPIEIPSSVGSVSEERAAEDIHNDDANHGLVSGPDFGAFSKDQK